VTGPPSAFCLGGRWRAVPAAGRIRINRSGCSAVATAGQQCDCLGLQLMRTWGRFLAIRRHAKRQIRLSVLRLPCQTCRGFRRFAQGRCLHHRQASPRASAWPFIFSIVARRSVRPVSDHTSRCGTNSRASAAGSAEIVLSRRHRCAPAQPRYPAGKFSACSTCRYRSSCRSSGVASRRELAFKLKITSGTAPGVSGSALGQPRVERRVQWCRLAIGRRSQSLSQGHLQAHARRRITVGCICSPRFTATGAFLGIDLETRGLEARPRLLPPVQFIWPAT